MKIEESHELKYSILEVKIPRIVLNMALWTLSRTNDILGLTINQIYCKCYTNFCAVCCFVLFFRGKMPFQTIFRVHYSLILWCKVYVVCRIVLYGNEERYTLCVG